MVKFVEKLKNGQIGTKIGVVVDMDPVFMIVVKKGKKTRRQKYTQKDKKAKRQQDKTKTKIQKKENKMVYTAKDTCPPHRVFCT